jgi:hypothetical protein
MGELKETSQKTKLLREIMKRHPGTILAFGEAGPDTEELFRGEPERGLTEEELHGKNLELDHHWGRPSFAYLTIRGNERSSLMIAVRRELVQEFKCLAWKKMIDGHYRGKRKRQDGTYQKFQAYTRMMVCEITLNHTVGHIGKTQVIMNVHLHHKTANEMFGKKKLEERFETMFNLINEHKVTVLMGDFNMSLTLVIPKLREKGIDIDIGAWFPWKGMLDGAPYMDSTGIFFVNMPAKHELCYGLDCIHDNDETGVLSIAETKSVKPGKDGSWYRLPKNGGPGQPLQAYLPKPVVRDATGVVADLKAKLISMLTPSDASRAEASKLAEGAARNSLILIIKEKRMFFRLWNLELYGFQKGSHYPLWVTTCNKSRRSPEAVSRRYHRSSSTTLLKPSWNRNDVNPSWNRNDGAWGWDGGGKSQWETNDLTADWRSKADLHSWRSQQTHNSGLRDSRDGSGRSNEENKWSTNTHASTKGAWGSPKVESEKAERAASHDPAETGNDSADEGRANICRLLRLPPYVPSIFEEKPVLNQQTIPLPMGGYRRETTWTYSTGFGWTGVDWLDADFNVVKNASSASPQDVRFKRF